MFIQLNYLVDFCASCRNRNRSRGLIYFIMFVHSITCVSPKVSNLFWTGFERSLQFAKVLFGAFYFDQKHDQPYSLEVNLQSVEQLKGTRFIKSIIEKISHHVEKRGRL